MVALNLDSTLAHAAPGADGPAQLPRQALDLRGGSRHPGDYGRRLATASALTRHRRTHPSSGAWGTPGPASGLPPRPARSRLPGRLFCLRTLYRPAVCRVDQPGPAHAPSVPADPWGRDHPRRGDGLIALISSPLARAPLRQDSAAGPLLRGKHGSADWESAGQIAPAGRMGQGPSGTRKLVALLEAGATSWPGWPTRPRFGSSTGLARCSPWTLWRTCCPPPGQGPRRASER